MLAVAGYLVFFLEFILVWIRVRVRVRVSNSSISVIKTLSSL